MRCCGGSRSLPDGERKALGHYDPASGESVASRGPIARASRVPCVAAPRPAAGGAGQPARARGGFIVDCHRSANRARPCNVSPEFQQIWVGHISVRNVDSEVIGWIARASLRHEDEVPRTIIGRPRVCGGRQGHKTAHRRHPKQRHPHDRSPIQSRKSASPTKRIERTLLRPALDERPFRVRPMTRFMEVLR